MLAGSQIYSFSTPHFFFFQFHNLVSFPGLFWIRMQNTAVALNVLCAPLHFSTRSQKTHAVSSDPCALVTTFLCGHPRLIVSSVSAF